MTDTDQINSIIVRAVVVLFDDLVYGPQLSQSWLPASTLTIGLLKFGRIDTFIVKFDARRVNSAILNLYGDSMTRFDGTNQTGVFRVK